jgi:hypothetical protein
VRVVVYHGSYGCDTGCCGHWIEVNGNETNVFHFDHPWSDEPEDLREFARALITEELGAEHIADIDWDACEVVCD